MLWNRQCAEASPTWEPGKGLTADLNCFLPHGGILTWRPKIYTGVDWCGEIQQQRIEKSRMHIIDLVYGVEEVHFKRQKGVVVAPTIKNELSHWSDVSILGDGEAYYMAIKYRVVHVFLL